ncbi:MAG: glucose-1-phosphate thymidylyltransferase [Chloroflexi bacterium]|nr:MAG: glucose-1-phosphate thymidylyltransferase [Chloroflexota bacterium]
MKGLVLSGGKGTRLRPFTYTGAKQLVPLANKPVLFYVLEDLVASGISDIGIVVGDTASQIEAAAGDGSAFGCTLTYIPQQFPGGLAHAVRAGRPFLGDDRFVMYLGDNFVQGGIAARVKEFESSDAAARLLLYRVPNPQDFGVAELEDGKIIGVEEKPSDPKSDLALVGIYFFDSRIHRATEAIEPSWRGELEITDAIRFLLSDGQNIEAHTLDGWWIDTGKMEDMLDANRLVLQELERRIDGNVKADCTVQGNVVVEAGAEVESSTLRGPLIIGSGTHIQRSYIGPFSAVAANCRIVDSELEHAIVMQGTEILDVPYRIEDSLIGRDVTVYRSHAKPKASKLVLGDHSKVGVI